MGNVYRPVNPGVRFSTEYAEAKALLEEHRHAKARVAEIDRILRELRNEDPDAVDAARAAVPFRGKHGSPHPGRKGAPAGVSIVVPIRSSQDFTE